MNIFDYFKVGSIVVEGGFNRAINNWTLKVLINYYKCMCVYVCVKR